MQALADSKELREDVSRGSLKSTYQDGIGHARDQWD